jgi:hypothetical protein
MTKKLTLHVTDADEPIVEKFKKSGGNLSELLRERLHEWNRVESEKGDFGLIELDVEGDLGKKFYGRWIYENRDGRQLDSGVAETRGGKYVVYYDQPPGGGLDQFAVYESIDEIPDEELRAKAEAVTGDGYEFLDI